MDFRVKKLILEEGMKNIAETEGVKLEMNFDDYHKTVEVEFEIGPDKSYSFEYVRHTCSYGSLENPNVNVFATIEITRQEVHDKKYPTAASFMAGVRNYRDITMSRKNGKSMLLNEMLKSGGINPIYGYFGKSSRIPKIKNVIFNYPATIVFWEDGDKTVVKCQGDDIFDPEKGLAMAIIKKMHGGKGNYCEIFKPWIEKYEKTYIEEYVAMLMKESVEFYKAACETSTDDIEGIPEGKVDPLMIKEDDEEAPAEKSCVTCDHKHKKVYESPCKRCLEDTSAVLPKWVPKKKETKAPILEKKTCWNCANHGSGKDKEPCCSCTTRRRNGTIHRNWEPKE